MSNYVLLMMAGNGTRFGSKIPKQFTLVSGKPIFAYILESYSKLSCIDGIVLIIPDGWINLTKEYTKDMVSKKNFILVVGGNSRSESIKNGLDALQQCAMETDSILIHDATHPYLDTGAVHIALDLMKTCDGVTLVERQYDTCYKVSEEDCVTGVLPRAEVVVGASPEIFHYGDLHKIYSETDLEILNLMTSAGALALAHNLSLKVVPTTLLNLKITYSEDMDLFRKLFKNYYFEE